MKERLKAKLGAEKELAVYSDISLQKLWKSVVFARRKGLMVKGDRTRGKAEQQVYLQMGNVSNTAFLSQKQSHGFSTRKQQWKTIWEPPALSHLSCLLALLLLLLEGRIVSFPLLSQFVGLGRDPREPQSEQDGGCRAPVPLQHQDQDGIWRAAPRGHRELWPAMEQPGDTGRDLNTFTRAREEWKK